MATDVAPKSTTQLSVGAGIAIAGIWLASSAFSIVIAMIVFVWSEDLNLSDASADSFWIIVALIAAPIVVAYFVTKMVLDKDDD